MSKGKAIAMILGTVGGSLALVVASARHASAATPPPPTTAPPTSSEPPATSAAPPVTEPAKTEPPATSAPPVTSSSPAPTPPPTPASPPATTQPPERYVMLPPTRPPEEEAESKRLPPPTTTPPATPYELILIDSPVTTPAPPATPHELTLVTDPPSGHRGGLLVNADGGLAAATLLRPAGDPVGPGGGSAWLREVERLSESQRDRAIFDAFQAGRWPRFLRRLVPLRLAVPGHEAIVWVMPDVFAIGTDVDFVRVPMKPVTAQRIADALGMILPTSKVVDEIDRQATVKLSPKSLRAEMQARGKGMNSIDAWRRANELAEVERAGRAGLASGHRKHIIVHPRMATTANRRRMWIYGWFYPTTEAALRAGTIPAAEVRAGRRHIQSVSTAHDLDYVDYSHGVQLVSAHATLDGRQVETASLMGDPALHPLLVKEGRFPSAPRYPT